MIVPRRPSTLQRRVEPYLPLRPAVVAPSVDPRLALAFVVVALAAGIDVAAAAERAAAAFGRTGAFRRWEALARPPGVPASIALRTMIWQERDRSIRRRSRRDRAASCVVWTLAALEAIAQAVEAYVSLP